MGRIENKFKELEERKEKALIAFVVAGDPSPSETPKIVNVLELGGADIIELGLPHTDPIADGPTIQKADLRALSAGANTDTVIENVREIRKNSEIPLVILTYYNPVLQYGVEKFCSGFSRAGADGLIVADLPVEEAGEVLKQCARYNLDPIMLVAKTTPPERIRRLAKVSRGFLYVVSIMGVTGERRDLGKSALALIRKVRKYAKIPLAVGFGISTPQHVKEVLKAGANGAIVGSAIVRLIEEKDYLSRIEELAHDLKSSTKILE
jgi:tryptophan synthase alpha chain